MPSPSSQQEIEPHGSSHHASEGLKDSEAVGSLERNVNAQCQEIARVNVIPTKTGDEDPASDTQFGPGSDGTVHSSHYEFDNVDDAAEIEELTYKPPNDGAAATAPHELAPSGSLLSRPDDLEAQLPDSGFSFARPERQQMDFTGSYTISKQSHMRAQQIEPAQVVTDTSGGQVQDHLNHADDLPDMPPTPHSLTGAEAINKDATASSFGNDDGQQTTKSKKRKKSRKRRYETATEQMDDHTQAFTVDNAITEPMTEDTSYTNDVQKSEVPNIAQERDVVHSAETSAHTTAIEERSTRLSSPHEQLQEDLSNATQHSPAVAAQAPEQQTLGLGHVHSDGLQAEQLSTAENQPMSGGLLEHETNYDLDAGHFLHRVSDRSVPAKVSKKKSKSLRRKTCPKPVEPAVPAPTLSEINDWMQIVKVKIHEREEKCSAEVLAQRQALQSELQESRESREALQDELDNVGHRNQALTATIEKQTVKLKAYEKNIGNFKKYVDGLGNDMDSVKKHTNSLRREIERLDEREVQRDSLFDQLNGCAEHSERLMKQAMRDCRQAQLELQAAVQQTEYLDQQLSEKVGLLAEQRDRCAQLEQQMGSTASSDEKMREALETSQSAILEKLHGMQVSMKEDQNSKEAVNMLQKTFEAVQKLGETTTATSSDVASAKDLVEKLGESLTDHLKETSASHQDHAQNVASAFQAHVDRALAALKDQLVQSEKHVQQEASHREAIRRLEEQLKANNVRMADSDSKLSAADARETQLKEQNATLQAKVTALRENTPPSGQAQVQLQEAKAELDAKIKALDSAKASLAGKADELRVLNSANAGLQDQMRSLQSRLEEMQAQIIDFSPERLAIEQKCKQEVDRIRKEVSEHCEHFKTEVKIGAKNELKKVTSDRNRFEREVKSLTEQLASSRAETQQARSEASSGSASKEEELKKSKRLSELHQQEIKILQTSLNKMKEHSKNAHRDGEEIATLSAQLAAETSKLEEKQEENSTLLIQIEDLQRSTAEAKAAVQDAHAELERSKEENDNARQALEAQLAEAKEVSQRESAGSKQLKESCNSAIKEEKTKGERQVKALQERLSEAQTELEKQKSHDEAFRAEVEQSWQHEQDDFAKRYAEIKQSVTDTEAQRDDALANNGRLRQELQATMDQQRKTLMEQLIQLQHRAVTAEEKLNSQRRPSSQVSNTSSCLRVPNLKEGITPVGGTRATQPSKPCKKADREHGAVVEDGPVPAPEELRPDSRRSNSANSKTIAHGPVVEESQFSNPFVEQPKVAVEVSARRNLPPKFSEFSDMLSARESATNLPEVVEETQYQEKLPSFAAFNQVSTSSQDLRRPKPASSIFSMSSTHDTGRHGGGASHSWKDTVDQASNEVPGARITQAVEEFTIYEDARGRDIVSERPEGIEARQHLRDSLSWSQEEKDKYTFQKSFPNPNSASKMVHPADRDLDSARRRHAGINRQDTTIKTPEVRGGRRDTPLNPTAQHIDPRQSSSPDFVHTSTRKMSTYHTPGGSGAKRRASRTNSYSTNDPRLAGRNPPPTPKRKSEGPVAEGYERERKKRLTTESSVVAKSRSLFPTSSSSLSDLARFPTMNAGPNRSTAGSQLRMRTLAGGSSRKVRGGKMSKNDEFNARFSQELTGR